MQRYYYSDPLSARLVEEKIAAESVRQNALESLFQTLLHNLMTGKVRLKNLKLSDIATSVPRNG